MTVRVDPTTLPDAVLFNANFAITARDLAAALEVLIEDPQVIERAGRAVAELADENYDDPWVSRHQFDGDTRAVLRAAFGATEEPTAHAIGHIQNTEETA